MSLIGTDVGARVSLKCEENGVPGENPRGRTGDKLKLAFSRTTPGSNRGRMGEKPELYPLW